MNRFNGNALNTAALKVASSSQATAKNHTTRILVLMASMALFVLSAGLTTANAHDHSNDKGEGSKMEAKTQHEVPESVAHVDYIKRPSATHYAGGQPEQGDFNSFAELGVETVINMRSQAEMSDIPQAAWVTGAKQAYYHIPIAGTDDINRENVALFHDIMKRERDNTLYIHCASSNRVGAMMALRAAWHEGASADEALAIGERYGMTSLRAHVESQLNQ